MFFTANVAQTNLFGTGDSLSLFGGASGLHELLRLDFTQPHFLDSDFTLGTQLYTDRRLMPGFTRDTTGIALTATDQLSPHLRAYVGYRLEQVSGEPDANAGPMTGAPPPGNDRISALRAGVAYDSRDSQALPTRGTDAGVGVELAEPLFGSQLALGTLDAWAGTNQRVGPAIVHVDGAFTALASPDVIPLADRLFMMGATDVRGFVPGAFGPVDADGDPIGGTMKLVGHASVELPVCCAGFSLESFVDYARVWDTSPSENLRPAPLFGASVGFGVIWRSPLGPVRVDVALPLVRGASPALVFGIGRTF